MAGASSLQAYKALMREASRYYLFGMLTLPPAAALTDDPPISVLYPYKRNPESTAVHFKVTAHTSL